jgi:hypothetical protein
MTIDMFAITRHAGRGARLATAAAALLAVAPPVPAQVSSAPASGASQASSAPSPAAAAAAATPVTPSPAASTAPAAAAPEPVPEGPLAPLAWLAGCWRGSVNQRDFREHWMPLRGNLMLGTSHTVNGAVTQDWEFLRLEVRAGGIDYIAAPSGQKETAFRYAGETKDEADAIFTFANPAHDFPQRILYRRGSEGWLYAHAEGRVGGAERKVIYPMRRVDCESGEFIRR